MLLGVTQFYQLDPVAKSLICTESATGSVYGPFPKLVWNVNYIPHCSVCAKHPICYLYMCDRCEDYFVKDFLHPGFCYKDPLCWDCLPTDSWCEHCMKNWEGRMLAIRSSVRPPLKKKPKKVILEPGWDPFTATLNFG